ncbi:gastrula zinc finger protein XlCGF66.1-like [Anomaloglossus baeobatrachus]|uniref:gastrula zinc finger protein XlCGF66.1-like n=1 Tax=Anomaloglossus baeobatrachus TaxID=238106 RepID=UPI003F4FF5B5
MEKDRKHIAETILNITLEIIYLLTGEDHMVVKKKMKKGEEWHMNQIPVIHNGNNYQEILQLINRISELLTGEIPIRCQDVAIYLTMEEWEYLEEKKNDYTDIIIENVQTPRLPGYGVCTAQKITIYTPIKGSCQCTNLSSMIKPA